MVQQQRIVDLAIGISVLGWATLGTWSNIGRLPVAIVFVTSLLHLIVGVLFLVRSRADKQGDLRTCLLAVPAVFVGGWVFRFAPTHWNTAPQILFVVGGGFTILSFAFLGRCFAVLPAIRGTVVRGPYSLVRHPAYLGELAMVVACVCSVSPNWGQPIVMAVTTLLFVIRIRAEERLLLINDAYQKYCQGVRWRLIPRVW